MLSHCPNCGSWQRDKLAEEAVVRCPSCGAAWPYRRLPLLVLTGASGVGKTTIGCQLLQKLAAAQQPPFLLEDADFLYTILPHETQQDLQMQMEELAVLSADLAQAGRPVLWTMAGNLDKLPHTYAARFFSGIRCLALTCEEQALRTRMRQGRDITDEGWIQSSVDYNNYFITHTCIGDTTFETLDITHLTPAQTADKVWEWACAAAEQ